MNKLNKRYAAVLALVGLTASTLPVLAGEEPTQPDNSDAQEVVDNVLNHSMKQYKQRVTDCRAFGGHMSTPETCKVDNAQLYYCNTIKTSVAGKCTADKVTQTIVNVNGLSIGEPLKPVWKERNGTGHRSRPHGTVPAPSSLAIMLFGLIILTTLNWRGKRWLRFES